MKIKKVYLFGNWVDSIDIVGRKESLNPTTELVYNGRVYNILYKNLREIQGE